MPASIFHGDCLALLPTLADNSIDAIVTDPPYCLTHPASRQGDGAYGRISGGFMNAKWDDDVAFRPDVWAQCLRVLKPGGHIAVFGGSRTHHRVWCAVEDAGFEIRDTLMWLYAQGFPKGLDVSKAIDKHLGAERGVIGQNPNARSSRRENGWDRPWMSDSDAAAKQVTAPGTPQAEQWQGWGTALKPSHEPILLARKPLEGTVAANVLTHGTGALNIDASRVPTDDVWATKAHETHGSILTHATAENATSRADSMMRFKTDQQSHPAGRWPPNLLHDGSEEVVECFPSPHGAGYTRAGMYGSDYNASSYDMSGPREMGRFGDAGSAARFFPSLGYSDDERRVLYCPKASKRDRAGSKHPTIKPVRLIEWLCKLICPPGGTLLDPFAGSGTTGQAAMNLGFDCILIEREAEYYNDILKRHPPADAH